MENPSKFIVDPRIDKPWGNTLREKLPRTVRLRYVIEGSKERQQAFLAPLPGIDNSNPRAIYLIFWANPKFYYCIYPCFLVRVLESRWKKLDTKLGLREVHNPLQQTSTIDDKTIEEFSTSTSKTLDPLRQDVNNIKFRSLVVGANFC